MQSQQHALRPEKVAARPQPAEERLAALALEVNPLALEMNAPPPKKKKKKNKKGEVAVVVKTQETPCEMFKIGGVHPPPKMEAQARTVAK